MQKRFVKSFTDASLKKISTIKWVIVAPEEVASEYTTVQEVVGKWKTGSKVVKVEQYAACESSGQLEGFDEPSGPVSPAHGGSLGVTPSVAAAPSAAAAPSLESPFGMNFPGMPGMPMSGFGLAGGPGLPGVPNGMMGMPGLSSGFSGMPQMSSLSMPGMSLLGGLGGPPGPG
eukprot:symbB.v1.2.034304.t1/scaffold4327.1/size41138/1